MITNPVPILSLSTLNCQQELLFSRWELPFWKHILMTRNSLPPLPQSIPESGRPEGASEVSCPQALTSQLPRKGTWCFHNHSDLMVTKEQESMSTGGVTAGVMGWREKMNFQAASLMCHSIKQQDLPIMKTGNGAKPNRECGVNYFKITNIQKAYPALPLYWIQPSHPFSAWVCVWFIQYVYI